MTIKSSAIVIGVVMLLFGAMFLSIANDERKKFDNSEQVQAEMIDIKRESHRRDGKTVYEYIATLKYSYEDKEYNSRMVVRKSNEIGDVVTIRIYKEDPSKTCSNPISIFIAGTIFTVVGLCVLIFGLVIKEDDYIEVKVNNSIFCVSKNEYEEFCKTNNIEPDPNIIAEIKKEQEEKELKEQSPF